MGVTRAVMQMTEQGLSAREIRRRIDAKYRNQLALATPTPYPPA
jgi:hypothetical protein